MATIIAPLAPNADLPPYVVQALAAEDEAVTSEPKVNLQTWDGFTVAVRLRILAYFRRFDSFVLNHLEPNGQTLILPNIPGIVLQKIVTWCRVHCYHRELPEEIRSNDNVKKTLVVWLNRYFDVHQNLFQDMYDGAKFLHCNAFLQAMKRETGGPVARKLIEERSKRPRIYY